MLKDFEMTNGEPMKKLQSRNNYGAKMKPTKKKNSHYFLVRLNVRDCI